MTSTISPPFDPSSTFRIDLEIVAGHDYQIIINLDPVAVLNLVLILPFSTCGLFHLNTTTLAGHTHSQLLTLLRLGLGLNLQRSRAICPAHLVRETASGSRRALEHALPLPIADGSEQGEDLLRVQVHGPGVGAGGPERAGDPELADLAG
jgi:hypothetical protein